MVDAFVGSLLILIVMIISLYKWIIIVAVVLSWLKVSKDNILVQIIHLITQPVFNLLKNYIPTEYNRIDFAPMIIILILVLIETFLGRLVVGM